MLIVFELFQKKHNKIVLKNLSYFLIIVNVIISTLKRQSLEKFKLS